MKENNLEVSIDYVHHDTMTIGERAISKYPIKLSEYSNGREYDFNESDRLTYIEGATDQQKIDIEKACKWLYEHCSGTSTYQLTVGGQMIPYNEFVEQFRKAMEE